MLWFLIIAGIFLVVGAGLFWLGNRQRGTTGLPAGEIVYSDTGAWQAVDEPLTSRRYGLVGRPDYLVRLTEGRRSLIVPVEVKSRRHPAHPYPGHILQLATYCLLVEDVLKVRPPYGLLHYADATLRIPFSDNLRRQVLQAAAEIRQGRVAAHIARSHQEASRCRACGYRDACGKEALG